MISGKLSSFRFSLFLLLLAPTTFAAEIEKKYQFQPSSTCVLQKRSNKDWQKADPRELTGVEPFSLHETYNRPELSTFYANHGVYSAQTECFVAFNSPEPEIKHEAKMESPEDEKKEEEVEEENESEFLHQARYRVLEVTPALGYLSSSANYKDLPFDSAKTTGIVAGGVLEYGITEHLSIGANLVYDHLSTSTTPAITNSVTASGLEDPKFFVSGKTEFGNSEVRLNLLFDTAFAHQKIAANGDSNVATGGFIFTPALGYEYHQGHNIYGAQIAYDLVKSDAKHDTVDDTGSITTVSVHGGKAVVGSLFFEHRFRKGEFGISVQYGNIAHTSEDGIDRDNGGSIGIATLYGEIEFNERISLLPSILFSKTNFEEDLENVNVDHVLNVSGTVSARFKF